MIGIERDANDAKACCDGKFCYTSTAPTHRNRLGRDHMSTLPFDAVPGVEGATHWNGPRSGLMRRRMRTSARVQALTRADGGVNVSIRLVRCIVAGERGAR